MKLLLRNKNTGAFFKAGLWIHDVRQAQEVATVSEACDLRNQLQLTGVQLYFLFGEAPDPRLDVVVELQNLSHPADQQP